MRFQLQIIIFDLWYLFLWKVNGTQLVFVIVTKKKKEKHLEKSGSNETNEVKPEIDATFCVLRNASERNV